MTVKPAFSVIAALKAAFGFVPTGIARAWLSLGLLLIVFGLYQSGAVPQAAHPVLLLASVGLQFAAIGALYRVAIFGAYARAEGLGFGGLQFAKTEWASDRGDAFGRFVLADGLYYLKPCAGCDYECVGSGDRDL
ncbi:hypothetical protein OVA03_03885 [Asticcacaulis sp. SL142]|uniref:hypothetical protein n=1 Tax=Asticcacaulis sp. SL142 TaxID=2995155 RepID=UPI00226CABEE|nr:hypothetical protein [Asticcacaulis sp. SL142]WAC49065.1 hypothetical protein OVA03_03885 [Asticcacaulis sp. SL142]